MVAYPTAESLAAASPADVLRAWRGLGYNRRPNLWRAAGVIVAEHGGRVPSDLEALRRLPGVGPYSARAVAALAFGRRSVPSTRTCDGSSAGTFVGGAAASPPTRAADGRRFRRPADARAPGRMPSWTWGRRSAGPASPLRRLPDAGVVPPAAVAGNAAPAASHAGSRRPGADLPFPSSRWLRGRILDRLRDARDGAWLAFDGPIGDHDPAAVDRRAGRARGRRSRRAPDRRGPRAAPRGLNAVRLRFAAMPTTVEPRSGPAGRRSGDLRARPARPAPALGGAGRAAGDLRRGDDRRRPAGPGARRARGTAHGARRDRGRGGGPGARGRPRPVGERPDRRPVRPGQQRRRRLRGRSAARARRGVGDRRRSSPPTPAAGRDAARNWDRIARDTGIVKVHLPVARDVAMFGPGSRRPRSSSTRCSGPGVRGALREPIRSAVELDRPGARGGVPVVAVDTPTAVDLSSGEPSDPAVRADLTVTFHRPKTGLLTRRGAAHAGKVLVAPIGIPAEADRG